jgi:poly-gamma-glutamate capsule biosynthesis protein CapA/YwtB (metallophosphatase superfamily)
MVRVRHGRLSFSLGLLALSVAACVSATPSASRPAARPTAPLATILAPSAMPTAARVVPTTPWPVPTATQRPSTAPPTASATETATLAPIATATPPTITLLFTGDINPGRCPAQRALAANDFTLPYQQVADILRAADLTIGSLDGTLSDLATPAPCPLTMNLIGPARSVEGLQFAGYDVLTTATNHALDCGSLGWRCKGQSLDDTRQNLLSAGIQPVGTGDTPDEARAPVILERQGVRFAFLGVNAIAGETTWVTDTQPGTAPLSAQSLATVTADIARVRPLADVVIVLPHWGIEYAPEPNAEQHAWATALMAAGADLVIGNHPHLVQSVETAASGGVVAYALGNFVFDQGPWDTRFGAVFEAVFVGHTLTHWRLRPVRIYDLFQPRWTKSLPKP